MTVLRFGFSEQTGPRVRAKSYQKFMPPEDIERAWFADLLWQAFPEARSENELAQLAADVLTSDRRPLHPRTVRNWLRQSNAPSFRYVFGVIALVGAEAVFDIIDPE